MHKQVLSAFNCPSVNDSREMVSKESSHMLTSQTNGKSTLADKLPGTMTVRSVLLNRDSPDIESRLKKRRNRTHQVRFKDLEDGSSSSGNSGTGDNGSHQKTSKDCASPHPIRKHSSRTSLPWVDEPHISSLPGQTSVVGAVRGDMASTIEVVAAFLARAPPHPLTPGPTRRCWTPPQANSLTLPMTRKPSTSTAIQTSPCLKKPLATHTRSHSLGDSVAIDGDDEHDSQDENFIHNHMSAHKPKDPNGSAGRTTIERTTIERKSKSRTEMKSAVTVVKNSRHSCPSSVSHTEPCQCCSVACREGTKRQGSSTPSLVRRRKRFSRTTSDPGKEVHYCTTPTQTESHSLSPPRSNTKLCTIQVQTESSSSCSDPKYSTTQSQTERHIQTLPDIEPNLPSDTNLDVTQTTLKSASCHTLATPSIKPCITQPQIMSPCASQVLTTSVNTMQIRSESHGSSLGKNQDPLPKQTVPYNFTHLTPCLPTHIPSHGANKSSSSVEKTTCTTSTQRVLSNPRSDVSTVVRPQSLNPVYAQHTVNTNVTKHSVTPTVTPPPVIPDVTLHSISPVFIHPSVEPAVSPCSVSDVKHTVTALVTAQDITPVVAPLSIAPDITPHSIGPDITPHSIAPNVAPHSVAPVVTPLSVTTVVTPLSVTTVVTPHSVAPVVTPHSVAPVVAPHSVAPFVTPHSVAPVVAPHSVAPVVTPHSVAPVVTPHSVTPVVTPLSVTTVATPHLVAPVVTPHSCAPVVTPHSVAPDITPHSVAPDITPHSCVPFVTPHSVALVAIPHTVDSDITPHSIAPNVTSHSVAPVVTPHSVAPVVTPLSVAPVVTPHSVAPVVTPHSVAPVVTPHSVAPVVTPHSVAPVVTPHSVAPVVTPHSVAPVVTPHSVAPVVTPHSVAPVVTPHSVAPVVTPHSVAPVVTPHSVAPDITPNSIAPFVTPHCVADITPYTTVPFVAPRSVTPVATPISVAPDITPHPVAPVVTPHSITPFVTSRSVAPFVTPHSAAPFATQHSVAPLVAPHRIPDCSIVAQSATPGTAVILPVFSCSTSLSVIQDCTSPISNIYPPASLTCSSPVPKNTSLMPSNINDITRRTPTPVNVIPLLPNATSPTNVAPCTFVTQTAISCTSISYYTTTHPVGPAGPQSHILPPAYATLVQTVSHCNIPCQVLQNTVNNKITPFSSPVPKLKSCTSQPILVKTYTSNLPIMQQCVTPTKKAPLYSSTFRAAPPYTPPCQTQDKRGIRLPPPPPPPPPYTPRKNTKDQPATQTSMLRTDNKVTEKDKDGSKDKKEGIKSKGSPKLSGRASSLKHRAQTPPAVLMKERGSPAKACLKSTCLSSAQAQLGVLHKMLCSGARPRPNTPCQFPLPQSQQGCSRMRRCSVPADCPTTGPLTPAQADTLRQVQEILGGLMSGAKYKLDPSKVTEKLLSPNGPLRDIRSLQTQLQSLEGVLETSQNTIKVLLDVIQDLEKKEAVRDGRHLYRTGQDIENCGTCRDCACIIYSVEHDFRLQEGQVVRTWKVGDPPEARPQTPTPPPSTPHQQDSPQAERPPVSAKKNRKKCFWFL